MVAGAPEWRQRLKGPLPPMAASLQSLELELATAELCRVPDYFDSLVALTSLTLSVGLRVSALLMLFVSQCPVTHHMTSKVDCRSCGRGAT